LSGHCQIYVGTSGSDDTIVLSNFSSAETPDVLVTAPLEDSTLVETVRQDAGPPTKLRVRAPEQWMVIINTISRQLGVSPQLLRAVIAVESNFDPMAVSRRGAVGLMQVMPATGRRFGVEDLWSPPSNVLAGATYLKFLMGLFDGDLELTLAAYNAGERAVLNAGRRVPNYPETHSYVRRVMARLRDDGPSPH
jgi:soluble lytic murein transglycosylase-like protein